MDTIPDDSILLGQYARTRDADAFAELVRRHAGLVYGACLRVINDPHDAEDAAQECFLELARNAGSIRSSVAAWLHVRATSRAIDAIRSRDSRRRHEERAMEQKRPDSDADATWAELAPHVDLALSELPDELRVPLVLHYLESRTQAEIARHLGVNQSTISRRIEKGTDELRSRLTKMGVIVSAAVLAALLGEKGAVAAPASLTASLGKMALAGVGTTAAASATSAAGAGLALKVTVAAAILAAAVAGGIAFHAARSTHEPAPSRAVHDDDSPTAAIAQPDAGGNKTMAGIPQTEWLPLAKNGDTSKWIGLGGTMQFDGDAWVFTGQDVRAEVGGMSWDDYILSIDVKIERRAPDAAWCVQVTGNGTQIYCQLVPGLAQIAWYCDEPKDNPKGFTHLARQTFQSPDSAWFTFQMKAERGMVTAVVNDREIVSAAIPGGTAGMPGLLVNQQKGCTVRVRGARVKFLRPTPEQLDEYGRDATSNWMRHQEPNLRPLRFSIADYRHDENTDIRLIELLGTAETVRPGELFVARGEYTLKAPAIGPLRLACQGTTSGEEQGLPVGEGAFELKAIIVDVVPGNEKKLDLFVTNLQNVLYPVLLSVQLEGWKEQDAAFDPPDETSR